MGQRANLIVKQGSRWHLYYDHWCANRLDVELFWGPSPARRFIEQLDPVDGSHWLDEVWCEGSAVLDLDERVLVFFGGEDIMGDVSLRRAHLSLMREMWPEWQIHWAHEGIVSIGAYLGEPAGKFLIDRERDPEERFRIETGRPEANRILMTDTKGGVTAARRVAGDEEPLLLGPHALHVIGAVAGTDRLVWQGRMPTGGLHVDYDTKALGFWWAHPTPAIADRTAAAWPGWDISWFEDRFEEHITRSDLDMTLPQTPLFELQTACIESLRHRCHWQAHNPARDLAARIGAEAVGAATDDARGSVGDETDKQGILDELSRRFAGRRG